MAFKLKKSDNTVIESPEKLFLDLRNRKVAGLLSQQADLLRSYIEHQNEPDIAIQMPTGSGKTLVGLLIAEWQRKRNNFKSLYLCPTKQLAYQVVEQAKEKYGINALPLVGSSKKFSNQQKSTYLNAESLAVTTYSSLFNVNPFFSDPDIIILDDAHASENYIANNWSLQINSFEEEDSKIFNAFLGFIKGFISNSEFTRISDGSYSSLDSSWVNKLPTPVFYDLHQELYALLEVNLKETKHYFKWMLIKDHLTACNLFYNQNGFLIRPLIPPTNHHISFNNANQRIYMSATLGEGGELERITGRRKLFRIPAPTNWEKQGVGRRLFFFPMRSLNIEDTSALLVEMVKSCERALLLTPTNKEVENFYEFFKKNLPQFTITSAHEMESSKQAFISKNKNIAIIANRYDGIDLPDDECRLLIASGLPQATNLQERFLISRMGASILYQDRVITRITQACGRCTRSATDYAAIFVYGEKLNNYLLDPKRRKYFHPELQAEIQFGIDESKETNINNMIENLHIFLNHSDEWNPAEDMIYSIREDLNKEAIPFAESFNSIVKFEIDYQNYMWQGDYEMALESCRRVLNELSGDDLRGYRAFWFYLAGSSAWLISKCGNQGLEKISRQYFDSASKAARGIPWLIDLRKIGLTAEDSQKNESSISNIIENLELSIEKIGTTNDIKFEEKIQMIMEGLESNTKNDFENAHKELGDLLGYESFNSSANSAPDPWWILSEKEGVVFEDHANVQDGNLIPTSKVRQAKGHPEWIRHNTDFKEIEFTIVILSRSTEMEKDALPFSEGIFYWSIKEFTIWAKNAIAVIRDLRRIFPGPGDLLWREEAREKYALSNLLPEEFIKFVKRTKLSEIVRE